MLSKRCLDLAAHLISEMKPRHQSNAAAVRLTPCAHKTTAARCSRTHIFSMGIFCHRGELATSRSEASETLLICDDGTLAVDRAPDAV